MNEKAAMSRRAFPVSVEYALEQAVPVEFAADDDLDAARATYMAQLGLWRERNGKDGGLAAFEMLITAARKLRALEALTDA